MKQVVLTLCCVFIAAIGFGQSKHPYYGGGRHTSSHGGHYSGAHAASHKGGHYVNHKTVNTYGRHKR